MTSALISVVIPCFNSARYLEQTLDSVFSQDEVKLEIIAIDDGSSDDTLAILEKFAGKITTLRQPNMGVSAARNRGTALAMGEYIQYLDADDMLLPGTLAERLQMFALSGADVVYCDWQKLDQQADGTFAPGQIVSRRMQDCDTDPQIATFTNFWAPPAAILYKRAIVDRIGGWNASLPVIQDARFLFDAAHAGAQFAHVAVTGAVYRVHNHDSLSRRNPEQFTRDVFQNAIQVQALWETEGMLSLAQRAALAAVYDYTARDLFRYELPEFNEALHHLKQFTQRSIFHYPEMAGLICQILGKKLTKILLGKLIHFKSVMSSNGE